MRAGLPLAALLVLLAPEVRAQGALRSQVDARRVGLLDEVQLTVTAEGPGALPEEVPTPPLANLRIVGGPSLSTQVSFVNGRMSQARTWTWLLQPVAVGRAEVGQVRASFGAGEETAPAIPIEVVAGSVKPRPPPRRAPDPFGEDPFDAFFGRERGRTAEPRLLVEAVPSRRSLYVGEPLRLTYYLYTQTSVSDLQFTEAPQYAGFWVEDLPRPERPAGEAATVEGVSYRRFPVLVKLLFPTRAGQLPIPASTLRIAIPRQGFFDSGAVVQRSTRPLSVEVKPIPDEPGFGGAVGRFRATATVDRPTLALGEAATLRFRVEGSGNLKWIDRAPEVSVPGAKVFPPQAKSDLEAGPSGIAGSRTWEFVVVPQTAGTLEVPSLPFSYFDPGAGRLVHAGTAPIALRVEGGTAVAGAALPLPAPMAAGSGGPLPIRASLEARRLGGFAPASTLALLTGAVLVLHAALWGGPRLGGLRRRFAGRTAAPRSVRTALRDLGRVGRDGMSKEAAAGLIEKTLHELFGSLDGDGSERGRAVRAVLDEVQALRYAPQLGDYSERLRELAGRAAELVRKWA